MTGSALVQGETLERRLHEPNSRDEVSALPRAGLSVGCSAALINNLSTPPPSSSAHLSAQTPNPTTCASSNPLPQLGSSNTSCPIQRQLTVNSHSNTRPKSNACER